MTSVRLIVSVVLSASVAASLTHAQSVAPPDARRTAGRQVPDARLVDEHGDSLDLRSLAGAPLILSPVFTTCPHACPAITASLEEALDGVGGCGETFNVLTLSFDPGDAPEDLRAYRERTAMPAEWILAAGAPDEVLPVLDAVDFNFVPLDGGGFAHANAIVFLTPDQRVAGYLDGLMYSGDEVKAQLRAASGRRPLIERARPFLIPVAAASLLAALLVIVLAGRAPRRAAPS